MIVVGKGGRYIPKNKAMNKCSDTVAHDVSARHWQLKRNGHNGFSERRSIRLPLGPCVVTRDY